MKKIFLFSFTFIFIFTFNFIFKPQLIYAQGTQAIAIPNGDFQKLTNLVDNVSLIGLLVFLGSFVPIIGSTPITLAISMQQFVDDQSTTGIVLLIAAGVVSVLDNFIRPMVLKGQANLHPLVAFISAFGGLQLMGFPGLFLGPILIGIFVYLFPIILNSEARH